MNIAICDDEPVFLKQLHNRIRSMKIPDCEVHEFTSGRDLLSFYVKGMYEVIILDVEMPELTVCSEDSVSAISADAEFSIISPSPTL